MSTLTYAVDRPPEEVVRGFIDALQHGRPLDALDVFALDGTIVDATGHEHRGIREIAQFVNRSVPFPLRIEEIRRDHDTVTVIVGPASGERRIGFRHTFTFASGRVRNLRIEKATAPGRPSGRAMPS